MDLDKDMLDYIEAQGWRKATFSMETLELMSKRTHALMTLLIAGASASGAFALGQWEKPQGIYMLWAFGLSSLWWYFLTAILVLRALRTREVRSPANSGKALMDFARGDLADFQEKVAAAGLPVPPPLFTLREGEIRALSEATKKFDRASLEIAKALDQIYLASACTPVIAALGLLAANQVT